MNYRDDAALTLFKELIENLNVAVRNTPIQTIGIARGYSDMFDSISVRLDNDKFRIASLAFTVARQSFSARLLQIFQQAVIDRLQNSYTRESGDDKQRLPELLKMVALDLACELELASLGDGQGRNRVSAEGIWDSIKDEEGFARLGDGEKFIVSELLLSSVESIREDIVPTMGSGFVDLLDSISEAMDWEVVLQALWTSWLRYDRVALPTKRYLEQ